MSLEIQYEDNTLRFLRTKGVSILQYLHIMYFYLLVNETILQNECNEWYYDIYINKGGAF